MLSSHQTHIVLEWTYSGVVRHVRVKDPTALSAAEVLALASARAEGEREHRDWCSKFRAAHGADPWDDE